MHNIKLNRMIQAALFAALTAVFSQIAFPLPFTPVPVNLATLAVMLAGGILGLRFGLISQIIYVCLGLVGLPVFAQFTGGAGIVLGPTGGYIAGYLFTAALAGLLFDRLPSPKPGTAVCAGIYAVSLLACYLPGTLWFMAVTGSQLLPSLMMCVVPFLPGDALKIAAASLLTRRLRPALHSL